MTRPATHYSKGEARKALLLDAAVEVIADRGLEGATHRAIAAAAGVPLSTTSYFFGSLDALIAAAVDRIADGVLASVEGLVAAFRSSGVDSAAITEHLDAVFLVLTSPNERQVLVQFETYLATSRRPQLAAPVQRMITAFESAVEAALMVLGVADPEAGARHVVALLDGFALQRIAYPRADDQEMALRAIRLCAESLMRGPSRPHA